MENLSKYYLKTAGLLFLVIFSACAGHQNLYKKEFSAAEKKTYAKLLEQGAGLFYQGTEACQMNLYEARELDPTNGDVYQEIGAPLLKRGIISQSIQAYTAAVKADSLSWLGWRGYMYLYFYRDYENAIHDFDALDELTPGIVDYPQSESVDFQRGIAYLMLKDWLMADSFFTKHLRYETGSVGVDYIESRAFLYRGITFYFQEKWDAALKDFDQGLKNLPGNANLLLWKAKTLQKLQGENDLFQNTVQAAKESFANGNHFQRPYVEEFFQIYEDDFNW
ncbi:MAG: hypothetical protein KDC24_13090 [Saprospiraceae bacterium]|nr:hypothetical protein [Saprospiraceae bacterium]